MKSALRYVPILILLLCVNLSAQFFFGKNKIQYSQFDWKVLSTTHFKIYFYQEESAVAEIAAAAAEESYAVLADKFSHHIDDKVPLIIYSAPTFFSQTNVTPGLLPESVAGFTEFYKGRVVVPFNGSVANFRRVIRHELVHVFTFDKIYANISSHRKTTYYGPPLWFTEGLAEYWSGDWDSQGEMVMADMALSGNLAGLEDLGYLYGSYFMYKYGQSFCQFVAETYGEDKLLQIFENWWKAKNFSELFAITIGESLKDASEKWVYHLQKEYYPRFEDADLPEQVSRPITPDVFAATAAVPVLELRGADDWVVYKANKLGYSGIYMRSPSKDEELTLIKGGRSPQFESLHLLQSRLGVSSDGRLAFISKNYEQDVIYIYDLQGRKLTDKFELPGLYHLASPAWSAGDTALVFAGATREGVYDLFWLSLTDSSLSQLTDDVYFDTDPTVMPNGDVVFASDRGGYGQRGYTNLYRRRAADGELEPLTYGAYHDQAPSATDYGIIFASDRQGTSNVYLLSEEGNLSRVTNFVTGAFDPVVRGDELYFTAFQEFSFSIFAQTLDTSEFVPVESEQVTFAAWRPATLPGEYEEGVLDYSTEFTLDIAQSAIAYDAVVGTIGGFQTVISDVLGNELYYVLISNTASTRDDFVESFNVGITYLNKSKRWNYGYGIYHLFDEYFDDYEGLFSERQTGAIGMLSYPLSKFTRLETSMFARHSYKKLFLFLRDRHAILSTNYLSYVHDNSLWDVSGPIDGQRYNLTVGLTTDLYSGRVFNRLAYVDFRNYLRLGKFSAFATRLFGFTSSGEEPQRIYLGGSWSLRGYGRKAFYSRNVVLISNELRFPLIDALYIGFPFGRLGFRGIRGALFVDAGSGWNDKFDRMYGAVGVGARVSLGYLMVLRFDLAKRTDFTSFEDGVDFDFFFGWNF
jgi:Tol biopolymer transport system component